MLQQSPFRPENCVNIFENTSRQKQLVLYFIIISSDNGYKVTGGIHEAGKVKDFLRICELSQTQKALKNCDLT